MIKKKRIILLIIFLLIFLVGCSKSDNLEEKEDTVKIKDYSEAEKVEFSNKDLEKTKNAVLSYAANPRKFNLTGYTIEAYRRLVGIDSFYGLYTNMVLDNEDNFLSKESKINLFLEHYSKIYRKKLNDETRFVMSELKKEIDKNDEEYNKKLDEKTKEFLVLFEEKLKLMDDIVDYYTSKKYEEDEFAKGKDLNERYLTNYKNMNQKFKEIYEMFAESEKIVINNFIANLEHTNNVSKIELFKSRALIKMFLKEFYASKLFIDERKFLGTDKKMPKIIKKEDKADYINNLKSIQKTLEEVISNLEKTGKDEIEKEKMNFEKYNKIITMIKEDSILTRQIIEEIEKNENEEVREKILKYSKRNFDMEMDFVELLK